MITSLIKILELPNFGHMASFESRDQSSFILRRPRVVNFANIIKIATFIKTTFID